MRRHHPIALFVSVLSMLVAVSAGAAEPKQAWVRQSGAELAIGNGSIELGFRIDGPRCAAVRLVNRLAGRTIPLRSDDFSIGLEGRPPLRSADFAFREARDEAIASGRRLTVRFDSASAKLRLDAIYELGHDDFFLRRRLEVTPSGPLALRQVDVWLAGLEGKCSHQGFGAPVLLDDTFWAVEFPAGHNQHADGVVRLSHFPGRTVADRFTTKTAVAGVAEPGQSARRFQQYVATFSQRGQQPLFVNYNTWWTLMPPTEKNSLELIDLFKRKLFKP